MKGTHRVARKASWDAARAALLLALLASEPSAAFHLQSEVVNGRLTKARWRPASLPIPFVANDQPPNLLLNLVSNSRPLAAIEAALPVWEIPPAGVRLNGTVATTDVGADGINLITFADTPKNRDASKDASAVTVAWSVQQGSRPRTFETDIIFNPMSTLATDGRASAIDIQSTLTHELGHAIGLPHTPIVAATMFPFNNAGQTHQRTLSPDDVAAVRALYGIDPGPGLGALTGRVVTTADAPVFGAHVVATDAEGIVHVSAVTDWEGDFTIPSLPPGSYRVYAEPLDGPATPDNILGAAGKDTKHPVLKEFRTAFAGGNFAPALVAVTAGQTTSLPPIRVEPERPLLNLQHLNWSLDGRDPWSGDTLRMIPGRSGVLAVGGEGVATLPLVSVGFDGTGIWLDHGRIGRDRDKWLFVPFFIRGDARPGARSLHIVTARERAAFTGLFEVVAR